MRTKTYEATNDWVRIPMRDVRRFGLIDLLESAKTRGVAMTAATVKVRRSVFDADVAPAIAASGATIAIKDSEKDPQYRRWSSYRAEFVRKPLAHGDIVDVLINLKRSRTVISMIDGIPRIRSDGGGWWRRKVAVHSLIESRVDPTTLGQAERDAFAALAGTEERSRPHHLWKVVCSEADPDVERFMRNKRAERDEDGRGNVVYTVRAGGRAFATFRGRCDGWRSSAGRTKIRYAGTYRFSLA